MDDVSTRLATLNELLSRWAGDTISFLPTLLLALSVIVAAWILARAVRAAIRRLTHGANRLIDRFLRRGDVAPARVSPAVMSILGHAAYWMILLLGVTIAARVSGVAAVSGWLDDAVRQLPNLIVGAAIIIVGYIVGVVAGEHISDAARAAQSDHGPLLGRLVQSAIFITALVTGIGQMGVDITFLVALFTVGVGSIFFGFSIAFGLGAKGVVGDLVSARAGLKHLRRGLKIRIDALEGEILEITSTQIVLDTPSGRVLVPARRAAAAEILIFDGAGAQVRDE